MEFNNKLYELRKQKGFSQEELANRLNVSRQTVSKWEVGDSTPDMEKLVAMSDLFGISLDELVLDKSPEPAPVEQVPVKSELYSDIKKHVLTDDNKKKVRKGTKIALIVFGIILAIDAISFVVYVAFNGLPK
ncbi:DNA-binding transcriptional regulator, XRE-family HTH domain [Ruminococcus sp. YRD2003]|jgi:transcriptional regulator with XRE-family HTH domain|uniref:helix-turn-helix domain-containing protein n=1 Tax=Ruminococcus sp. YRD2003 TaxID=1452313 RepID=UPI0008C76248|nr:DNA-binding transcriptional regulator, XRE-family HTH domain [Ruminococcus flavefaciens]